MSHRSEVAEWNTHHNKQSVKGASFKDLNRRRRRRLANAALREWHRHPLIREEK